MKTFENDRVSFSFDPAQGGRLCRFELDGYELLYTGDTHPLLWGCYPMAPWAGRVRNGRFGFAGQEYALPVREGPHSLHGTVLDQAWYALDHGVFACDFGPDWPWSGRVVSTLELSENTFTWRMSVESTEGFMPIVIGWHPWFNRCLHDGALAQLHFSPQSMFERDVSGLPSGRQIPPTKPPWDDCFPGVSTPPRIQWLNGPSLTIESSCAYWVIYDETDHALCVEPQSGPPDGFNLNRFELAGPEQPLSHWMRWSW
ncbi:MAG: aldose 1-epimerase [Myxococcota bacterium]|nr:aldose 1-epimerase [Myxococcota bacterium]